MDYNKLRLKYSGNAEKMNEILQQECREKTRRKLPETLKCDAFRFPSLAVAEMATSDIVAEEHCRMLDGARSVIDMTCGLGIDAFAMARSGCKVTAVELDAVTAAAARHNVAALGLTGVVEVVEADSVEWLRSNPDRRADLIFIDPARRDSAGRHFALADCRPDVVTNLQLLTQRSRRLIIKASPMLDISAVRRELPVEQTTVLIGTRGECKELVTVVPGNCDIVCVTLLPDGSRCEFRFSPAEETGAMADYAVPDAGWYLYEPYPALMKAGAGRLLSQRFGVARLHPNTNLYASPRKITEFPGSMTVIEVVVPFDKKGIRSISATWPELNVATRNFPMSAPELARRLKTKDGGNRKLFGTTVGDNRKVMIISASCAP